MAMGLKMSMKLSQQLRMTPQLQQAIKLLQLSRIELETEVRKELDENPVLEEIMESVEDEKDKSALTEELKEAETAVAGDTDPTKQDEFDWESYVEGLNKPAPSAPSSGGNDEIMNYENVISTQQTLNDHLMWQVNLAGFNDEEKSILSILISYINDDGYLHVDTAEMAKEEGLEQVELDEMIPFIHEFDPPGVGARNLKECLLIQAKHMQEDTNDLVKIIDEHLSDLEKKNYPAIAKALEMPVEEVVQICEIILGMDPKPGRIFMTNDTQFITPDVYVHKVGEEYVVSLNEDGLPRLRVSNLYKNLIKSKDDSVKKSTQEYVQDKLRSAIWLIKSIHQRQRTIYKVAESIVKHQYDFFEKGAGFIKPMILRDIAGDIGMHESTVSRVTTNKYLHTPRGIYELKYFFNSGISKTDGDSVASESVKLKIKDLVDAEDPKKPLSDQKIVDLLKKEGITIARRTVAKYRDVLKILPSSKRKKYY